MRSISILSLLLLSFSSIAQPIPTTEPKAILDSFEVIKKVGAVSMAISAEPTEQERRIYNIERMLFVLPFEEVDKLLNDTNRIARAYGFLVMSKKYFDSLNTKRLGVLEDTSKLLLFTQRGIIDAGLNLGMMCRMMYEGAKDTRKIEAMQPKVEEAVKDFIIMHAMYPDSYLPLDIKDYSWSEYEDKVVYELVHGYKLKNKDGELITVTHYFIVNSGFEVVLIEKDRSDLISVDPPRLDEWLDVFGK